MEKFLFIIREDIRQLKDTPGLQQQRIQEMTKWSAALAESGNNIGGNALETHGSYIKNDTVLSDGPFIEAKECISGFIFINAENIDQAISIAQTCPYVLDNSMAIEVRPVLLTENNPQSHV